jgi:hypothetical protein
MKFQRATEFTRVPPDLTTAILYTNTWFSVYCFHCIHGIVTFKPKVIPPEDSCVLGGIHVGGKRLIEGNGRSLFGIPAELCQISSGHWTRLPMWKWPECFNLEQKLLGPIEKFFFDKLFFFGKKFFSSFPTFCPMHLLYAFGDHFALVWKQYCLLNGRVNW